MLSFQNSEKQERVLLAFVHRQDGIVGMKQWRIYEICALHTGITGI